MTCNSSKLIENNYIGISLLVFLTFAQFKLNLATPVNEEFHRGKLGYLSHTSLQ